MKAPPLTKEVSKPVGIWIRVSTEDQAKGESPAHHLERARAYAKAKGWTVKEVYDLSGVSGKSVIEHPEAKRMLEDVKKGHITGLAFSKLARLARNTRELLDFSDYFRTHNADLISLQESIDTSTPAGRLFYTIIAAMAQWEREEIGDRVKASIKIRAQLGKNLGGSAPFGYQWKDNKLVIDAKEAPIRTHMHELFVKNKRMKGVARQMNEAGYRTRKGAKFTDTTVLRLLQDTTAKGLYRANHTYRDSTGKLHLKPESDWIHSPVEAIITENLWNQCNALIKQRKDKKPPGPKTIHLFAGLLWCGCGHKMYVFSRTPKYICPECRTKIPTEDIEAIFREELRTFFVSPEKLSGHLEKADEYLAETERRLTEHVRELNSVKSEMQKVYRLYIDNQIAPEGFGTLYRPLEEREKQLSKSLPELEAQLDALKINRISADEVISEATNLYNSWPKFTTDERRQLVESITEKIVVTGDEVDITLSYLPSSEELTKRQRNLCAMLPLCDRVLNASRKEFLPLRNRGIPIPSEPNTIGGYLRRRRMQLGIFQPEAARMLGISMVTLSRWECDKIYPTPEFHQSIIAYLGHDRFFLIPCPELKNIQSNERSGVANLSRAQQLGVTIKRVRLEQKMTGKECAKKLGVDAKTLRDWENGKRSPIGHLRKQVSAFVGYDLF